MRVEGERGKERRLKRKEGSVGGGFSFFLCHLFWFSFSFSLTLRMTLLAFFLISFPLLPLCLRHLCLFPFLFPFLFRVLILLLFLLFQSLRDFEHPPLF